MTLNSHYVTHMNFQKPTARLAQSLEVIQRHSKEKNPDFLMSNPVFVLLYYIVFRRCLKTRGQPSTEPIWAFSYAMKFQGSQNLFMKARNQRLAPMKVESLAVCPTMVIMKSKWPSKWCLLEVWLLNMSFIFQRKSAAFEGCWWLHCSMLFWLDKLDYMIAMPVSGYRKCGKHAQFFDNYIMSFQALF